MADTPRTHRQRNWIPMYVGVPPNNSKDTTNRNQFDGSKEANCERKSRCIQMWQGTRGGRGGTWRWNVSVGSPVTLRNELNSSNLALLIAKAWFGDGREERPARVCIYAFYTDLYMYITEWRTDGNTFNEIFPVFVPNIKERSVNICCCTAQLSPIAGRSIEWEMMSVLMMMMGFIRARAIAP